MGNKDRGRWGSQALRPGTGMLERKGSLGAGLIGQIAMVTTITATLGWSLHTPGSQVINLWDSILTFHIGHAGMNEEGTSRLSLARGWERWWLPS